MLGHFALMACFSITHPQLKSITSTQLTPFSAFAICNIIMRILSHIMPPICYGISSHDESQRYKYPSIHEVYSTHFTPFWTNYSDIRERTPCGPPLSKKSRAQDHGKRERPPPLRPKSPVLISYVCGTTASPSSISQLSVLLLQSSS